MTRETLAGAIQQWQDEQWAVSLCLDPPTPRSYALADHLIAAGFIHRSHAATLGVDDLLAMMPPGPVRVYVEGEEELTGG